MGGNSIRRISNVLDKKNYKKWEIPLSNLHKGECIVNCKIEGADGQLHDAIPLIIKVPKISEN